jgi:O-antigen ligase
MISLGRKTHFINIKQKDIVISISLALYVFSVYLINTPMTRVIGGIVLYIFLGISFYKLITKQTPLKFTSYILWYLIFGILGLISFFYAENGDYVIRNLYTLLVAIILTFSFIQYVRKIPNIITIFAFFAYFPIILVFYLLISGNVSTGNERLGTSLFGNPNIFAGSMMLSLFCVMWFIFYGSKRYKLINTFWALVILFVISMSGGRKYILIAILFLLVMMILKYWKKKKINLLLYISLFSLILLASVWAFMNISILYDIIGVRFEGLLNFISGDIGKADYSTIYRYMMIANGWQWFLKQPIIGYGLNNFSFFFSQVLFDVYAHNNYIELLVDLGLLGTLIYYSFYIYIIVKLFQIKNDNSGLRNFFLAFLLVLSIFELSVVTYNQYTIQIFLALASVYVWLYDKRSKEVSAYN